MKANTLLQWWDRVRSGLIDTIDKFHDADLDFAPFNGAYSVRQLVLHIAQEEYGEVQLGISRQITEFPPAYPVDSYPTVAAAKALLADVHEGTTHFVGSVTDAQLAEEVEAGWGGHMCSRT